MAPSSDVALVVAVVAVGPPKDAAACLTNVRFADEVVALCADAAAEGAFRQAGAPTVLEPSIITVDTLAGPRCTLPAALCEGAAGKWVLVLTSDERVSVEFQRELSERIPRLPPEVTAVAVPLRRHIVGTYLEHGGWNALEPRLFRVGPDTDPATLVLGADVEDARALPELETPIVQLGDRSLSDAMRSLNVATDVRAQRAQRHDTTFCPGRLLASVARVFLSRFVTRRGFRDGVPGLVASVFSAAEGFVVAAKQFEGSFQRSAVSDQPDSWSKADR